MSFQLQYRECGVLEGTIRGIIFVGLIIAGFCLLLYGPKYPDNQVTAVIAIGLMLVSPLAIIAGRANTTPKMKTR